jgi:hypothetical protein
MVCPTGHDLPAAMESSPMVPSSKVCSSIVALSVSMSAMTWPDLTLSPGLTCHLTMVPTSMVSERRGMVMLVGMGGSRYPNGQIAKLPNCQIAKWSDRGFSDLAGGFWVGAGFGQDGADDFFDFL